VINRKGALLKCQLDEARYIIRAVCIVVKGEDKDNSKPLEVRAFVQATEDSPEYITIEEAMMNPDTRESLYARARAEIIAWKARYASLKEFALLLPALEAVIEMIPTGKKEEKKKKGKKS